MQWNFVKKNCEIKWGTSVFVRLEGQFAADFLDDNVNTVIG